MKNDQVEPQILESKLTVTLRLMIGGSDYTTSIDCDLSYEDLETTIARAKFSFLASAQCEDIPEDNSSPVSFSIRMWVLEEVSLIDLIVEVGGTEIVQHRDDLGAKCEALVSQVLPRFIKTMERNEVGFSDR